MNKFLSLYVAISTTTMYSGVVVVNGRNYDKVVVEYDSLRQQHRYVDAVNAFTQFTTRTRNNVQSRLLQDDIGLQLDSVWSDDRICNGTLEGLLATDYERSMDPCSCSRTLESSSNGTVPGLFGVNCDYSYCPQCLNIDTSLCGILYDNYTYLENVDVPAYTVKQIQNASFCIQYKLGSSDSVCLTNNLDYINYAITCSISINGQQCLSCNTVTCTSDGGSVPVNASDPGSLESSALTFDCSNINGLYSYNECNYIPYTTTQPPPTDTLDPLSFVLYSKQTISQSCLEKSNTTIAPFPVPVPTSDNVNDAPAPTVGGTTPGGSNPTSDSKNESSSAILVGSPTGSKSSYNRIVAVIASLVAFYLI